MLSGGVLKVVEFFVVNDIVDLFIYVFGIVNNGGGIDGEEFMFLVGVFVSVGIYIYVVLEIDGFIVFFGFVLDYDILLMGINGDDVIELFKDGSVIDMFGDINIDGSGIIWEYLDGWVYCMLG